MNIENLLKKINIKYKKIDLYVQSLTHSTFTYRFNKKYENYENLEFLGDSLVNFTVTEYVYEHSDSDNLVGKLSTIKNFLISNEILAGVVKNLGLSKYLRLGKSLENINLEKENSKILADIFESFVAAIYLDSKSFEYTKEFIKEKLIKPNWNNSLVNEDYKTILQELIQCNDKKVYENLYEFVEKNQIFYVTCRYKEFVTKSFNTNKKIAQKEAARLMLKKIKGIFACKKKK